MKERREMSPSEEDRSQFVRNSVLYKEFLAERAEILKHKWIESEKGGKDIGFEKALLDWIVKHPSNWREKRMREGKAEVKCPADPYSCPLKRSCEVAKETHETKKRGFICRRPDHGRGSNSPRATANRARNHRGQPAAQQGRTRGNSLTRSRDCATHRRFYPPDRKHRYRDRCHRRSDAPRRRRNAPGIASRARLETPPAAGRANSHHCR